MDYKKLGRPKKVYVNKKQKLVRVDARTIIEVDFDIPDKKAIAAFLKRLEESVPEYGKGAAARALAIKAKKAERPKKPTAANDPSHPRRKK